MATEKIVTYTVEQTAMVIDAYTTTPTKATVEALALQLGKSTRSIIAKLSREKVYVKPEYTTKTGAPVVKKNALVDLVAEKLGLTEPEATSFEHVNKTALVKLIAALTPVIAETMEVE